VSCVKVTVYEPPEEPALSDERVAAFLGVALTERFFGRILVRKGTDLRNSGQYPTGDKEFGVFEIDSLERALTYKLPLLKSCDYDGHVSVLFVPRCPDGLRNSLIESGHAGIAQEVLPGEYDKIFGPSVWPELERLLASKRFGPGEVVLAFSHDAEYMYEIVLPEGES
jgi:hypothetical protein